MKITEEPYSEELVKELSELFELHCSEVSMFGEKVNPDLSVYKIVNDAGFLRMFIARVDGNAIGYIVFMVKEHHHYKNMKVAEQDILFLHPDYRKGFAGIRLIKEAEKKLDVDCILQHTKNSKDLSPIFKRLGYKKMDTIYIRKL